MSRETRIASFTVAGSYPPKDGKKTGSIKDTNNNWWSVWPDKLGAFDVGKSYRVEYTTWSPEPGKSFHTIVAVKLEAPMADPEFESQEYDDPPFHSEPQQNYAPGKLSPHGDALGPGFVQTPMAPRQPTHPIDAEHMFVGAILKAMIQANQLNGNEVIAVMQATKNMRTVWKATFGAS